MKILPILVLFLSIPGHCAEPVQKTPFLLISGFDDVVRQAENTSLFRAGLRLLRHDQTFSGMPELYSGLARPNGGQFTLISGISSAFGNRIARFLSEAGFPRSTLYLRSWLTEFSIEAFKIRALRKALGGSAALPFVVIFDNSGPSLDMARSFPRLFPGQVKAIYLHEIVERPAPDNALGYVTAYDIAVSEERVGRLNATDVERVAHAILSETDAERIIPSYAYCPREYDPCGSAEYATCVELREKIRKICRAR